jgi:hypothetical protein
MIFALQKNNIVLRLSKSCASMKIIQLQALMFFVFCLPTLAVACKCADPGDYDVIFRGRVLSTMQESHFQREHFGSTDTHFEVIETIQGKKFEKVHVHSESPQSCGVIFESGKTYFVYGKNYGDAQGLFETKYCYGRLKVPPAGEQRP